MGELVRIVKVKTYNDTLISAPKYTLEIGVYGYKLGERLADVIEGSMKAVINVSQSDTLDYAQKLIEQGLNPLVLCHADDHLPGGFVSSGAGAQEEEIWRRTNICRTLDQSKNIYPLDWNQFLLAPQVTVFKDAQYNVIDKPFQIDIINAVALRSPPLAGTGDNEANRVYGRVADRTAMDEKIRNLFRMALFNKNDSVVFGALGCGAFSNPPEAVAQIFKKYTLMYRSKFKHIGFAVLGSNYTIFQSIANN